LEDKQGSAADKQKLSLSRSIKVVKKLVISTKGFQSVQAVYLRQTDRFGAPSENRVVEM